ncbi:hypothetical protein F66182_5660 [Fusarium sp. NRRL 66182]|nr:hypothetical protein F66182_5660 [Fusarium sp. NRRL 66182]
MASKTSSTIKDSNAVNYALGKCCFHDHQDAPYRFCDQIHQIRATAEPTSADGLVEQPGLTATPLPRAEILLEPRTDHEFHTMSVDKSISASSFFSFLPRTKQLRLPSEAIDPGHDLKKEFEQYLHDIQVAKSCNILAQWLPLSHVITENDEGLEFPSTVLRWQTSALREFEANVTPSSGKGSALIHDADTSSQSYTQAQLREIFFFDEHPRAYPEPVSPPLSPVSELDELFVPNSDIIVIDSTPEPSSPINTAADKLQWDLQKGCVDSEPLGPSTMPSSPPPAKTVFLGSNSSKHLDIKLDVPLMPSSPEVGLVQGLTEHLVLEIQDPSEIFQSPVEQGFFFEEALQTVLDGQHHQIDQLIEEERLNPEDSLLRLPIPAVDFHLPNPEWNAYLSSPEEQFKSLQRIQSSAFSLPFFGGLNRLEALLKWTPVPHGAGRVLLTETPVELDPISRELLSLEVSQLSSRDYITKRPKLEILQLSRDEEIELEVTSHEEAPPLTQEPCSGPFISSTKPGGSLEVPPLNDLLNSRRQVGKQGLRRKVDDKAESLLLNATDPSAASSLLSSFIQLRQPKKLKTSCTSYQPTKQSLSLSRENHTKMHPITEKDAKKEFQEAPVPHVDLPMLTCRYVVSMNLSRIVFSCLEKSCAQIELIDRDFSQHNTVVWSPSSAQRKEVVSSLAFEADISLCPAAGLIMTTILKVKQKPLPGSNALTPLRERVKLVSEKYESLFILVSESNPHGEYVGSPSVSDMAGYADFVRFTTGLQAGISTYLVSGSEGALSKWALSIMCRYSSAASQFGQFLDFHDGTWGLFLRRAGLNISASQIISGLLQAEYNSNKCKITLQHKRLVHQDRRGGFYCPMPMLTVYASTSNHSTQ